MSCLCLSVRTSVTRSSSMGGAHKISGQMPGTEGHGHGRRSCLSFCSSARILWTSFRSWAISFCFMHSSQSSSCRCTVKLYTRVFGTTSPELASFECYLSRSVRTTLSCSVTFGSLPAPQLLQAGWPLFWKTWKTWKSQGIEKWSGKSQGKWIITIIQLLRVLFRQKYDFAFPAKVYEIYNLIAY